MVTVPASRDRRCQRKSVSTRRPGWHPGSVRLQSRDGASLDLGLTGYQFDASARAPVGTDWDANWLLVRGEVHTADGVEWTFLDPCLTTWESRSISSWLRSAAAGQIAVAEHWSGAEDLLHFTEPNVAFSLQQRAGNRAVVRVHFSLEALPPSLHAGHRPDIFDYHVAFDVNTDDLTAAADAWDRQCAAFPIR